MICLTNASCSVPHDYLHAKQMWKIGLYSAVPDWQALHLTSNFLSELILPNTGLQNNTTKQKQISILHFVDVLLYAHRNRRFIRDGSPGRPPRLSHSSWALKCPISEVSYIWSVLYLKCPISHFSLFNCCLSVVLQLEKGSYCEHFHVQNK